MFSNLTQGYFFYYKLVTNLPLQNLVLINRAKIATCSISVAYGNWYRIKDVSV